MRGHTAIATAALALSLFGCSPGSGGLGNLGAGPLPYQHANVLMPTGYSESLIGPDRYRIEVKGPVGTPRQRMEAIASTRAAEIGATANLRYFKIEGVQHTTSCRSYTRGGKPGAIGTGERKTIAYEILTADVAYAKEPADPAYLESKPAFEKYRAELDQGQAASPALAASAATCG